MTGLTIFNEDALISSEVIDSLARPQLARSAVQVKERLDKGVRKTYPIFANRFLEAVA